MCEYCNEFASYGNKAIVNNGNLIGFIAEGVLNILIDGHCISSKTRVNFCPMCGKMLQKSEGDAK
jgi:hypothetical protein